MSRIEELIATLCPNGVEFVGLSEIFETRNGYTPSKSNASNWTNGTIPWFRMEDIRENGRILDSAIQSIPQSAVKGGRLFPANSIIIATSATIGEHALITIPYMANQRFTALWLKPSFAARFDMKFVFYFCFVLDEWCRNNITTSSFASVDMSGFKRFKFPVPPIEVQHEIVNVLDSFSKLEAELEAELEARRHQYAYYRDSLLTFDDIITPSKQASKQARVRWVPMGEICLITQLIKWTQAQDNEFAYIDLSSVDRETHSICETQRISKETAPSRAQQVVRTGDVLFGTTRPTLMRYCSVPKDFDGQICSTGFCVLRPDTAQVLPRWIFHLVSSYSFQKFVDENQHGAGYPAISDKVVMQFKVPVPTIPEQVEIISTLDSFNALVSDLSIGLPAELNARRQQYEYYRDRLLTFREAA